MKESNRIRKFDIQSINALKLNEEQVEAKRLIIDNQIVIITGQAGSGKIFRIFAWGIRGKV